MRTLDVVDICAIISNGINVFIIFPILIYSFITFYKYSAQLMEYRNKPLVYIINIHVFIMIFIYFGYISSVHIWGILHFPIWSIYIPIAIGVNSSFMLLALKIYLLYYELQYHLSIVHRTYHQEYNKWFIIHRNRFGNYKYLFIVLFIPYITLITSFIIFMYQLLHHSPIFDATQAMFVSTQLGFSAYIYFKVRKYEDIYGIRQEIYYSSLPLFAGLCAFAMTVMILRGYKYLFSDHWNTNNELYIYRIEIWIYQLIMMAMALGLALFSTAYPVYILTKQLNSNLIKQQHNTGKNTHTIAHSDQSNYPNGIKLLLESISNNVLFKLFIQHLVNEMNTESLVFLVELVEIKSALQWKYGNKLEIFKSPFNNLMHEDDFNFNTHVTYFACESIHTEVRVCLPDDIATCEVLHKYNKFNDQLIELYNKYIVDDSIHQLNISYEIRNNLDIYFTELIKENKNEYDGFRVFDECAMEIIRLLLDPFIRFKNTKQFKKYKETIENNENNEKILMETITTKQIDCDITVTETPKTPFLQSMDIDSPYKGTITTIIE